MQEDKPNTESKDEDNSLVWKLPEVAVIRFLVGLVVAGVSGLVRLIRHRDKSAK